MHKTLLRGARMQDINTINEERRIRTLNARGFSSYEVVWRKQGQSVSGLLLDEVFLDLGNRLFFLSASERI